MPVTTVPAWSDVIDLNFPNQPLEDYLIETLVGWVQFGVDGFRCDVASLLPEAFWQEARRRVAQVKPSVIWLAESVHLNFVGSRRAAGLTALSDSEVFQSFDMAYDYDIWPIWQAAVTSMDPTSRYLEMVRMQSDIYPANAVKMRCVENHDQARILALAPSRNQALAWTAFEAFNKGSFLIYAGQEAAALHTPSLFDKDPIDWKDYELQPYLTRLAKIKKEDALVSGTFTIPVAHPAVVACWETDNGGLMGIFNVRAVQGSTPVPLPDGSYQDTLNGDMVTVKEGQASIPDCAAILRYDHPVQPAWFYSILLDLHIPPERID